MSDPMGFAGGSNKASGDKKKRKKSSPKKSELKPRQAKAVEGVLAGKSMRKASLEADFPVSMANKAGEKVFTPAVRAVLEQEMHRQGITDELLVRRIRRGLSAQVVKTATHEGVITDVRKFRDFEQIGKYVDRALELKGHIKRGGAGDVNVNIPIALVHSVPRPERKTP